MACDTVKIGPRSSDSVEKIACNLPPGGTGLTSMTVMVANVISNSYSFSFAPLHLPQISSATIDETGTPPAVTINVSLYVINEDVHVQIIIPGEYPWVNSRGVSCGLVIRSHCPCIVFEESRMADRNCV